MDIEMVISAVWLSANAEVVVQESTVVVVVTIAAPGQPAGLVDEHVNAPPPVPLLVGVPAGIVTPAVVMLSCSVTAAAVGPPDEFVTVIVSVTVPPAGETVSALPTFVSVTGVVTAKPLVAAVVVVFPPDVADAVAPATDVAATLTVAFTVSVTMPAAVTLPEMAHVFVPLVLAVVAPVAVLVHVDVVSVTPAGRLIVNVPVPAPRARGAVAVYVIGEPPGSVPGFAGFCAMVGETVRSAFAPPHCEPRVARTARAARRTISRPNFFVPTV
jgi:hypothetical protein